jgi:REP element-mobilizing transposase RayT
MWIFGNRQGNGPAPTKPDQTDMMPMDMQHHRRSIRLPDFDYSGPGDYFVTLVALGRECLFGEIKEGVMVLSAIGGIAEEHWRAIPEHFPMVELGAHVVMPNHVHGIIIIRETNVGATHRPASQRVAHMGNMERAFHWDAPTKGSLGAIIGAYKMSVTRRIHRELDDNVHVWQRNYFEHVIRNDEEHSRIHDYIESNIENWAQDDENPLRSV